MSEPHQDDRPWDKRIKELYDFLVSGTLPEGVTVGRWRKLSPSGAMTLIWFLQEITHVLPDNFEQCVDCKSVFNDDKEGEHIGDDLFCDDCSCGQMAERQRDAIERSKP